MVVKRNEAQVKKLNEARGKRIADFMQIKKLSVKQLAEKAGVSTKTVYKALNGYDVRPDSLAAVAEALGTFSDHLELKAGYEPITIHIEARPEIMHAFANALALAIQYFGQLKTTPEVTVIRRTSSCYVTFLVAKDEWYQATMAVCGPDAVARFRLFYRGGWVTYVNEEDCPVYKPTPNRLSVVALSDRDAAFIAFLAEFDPSMVGVETALRVEAHHPDE